MFTTRIELHKANDSDYEKLHSEMEKEGFSRKIRGDDGIIYNLPTAEYNKEGSYTIQTIYAQAERAANKTGKAFYMFISEATKRVWKLDVAKK